MNVFIYHTDNVYIPMCIYVCVYTHNMSLCLCIYIYIYIHKHTARHAHAGQDGRTARRSAAYLHACLYTCQRIPQSYPQLQGDIM